MTISSAKISMNFRATQTNQGDIALASCPLSWDTDWNFVDGTGAGQASKFYSATRVLAASATENLDLAGVLADAFGVTFTADRVKAIKITAAAANTNDVQVTRPASNGFALFMAAGDGHALGPGAGMMFVAPNANGINVTSSTGDILTFTNSAGGTPVTYSIAILFTV